MPEGDENFRGFLALDIGFDDVTWKRSIQKGGGGTSPKGFFMEASGPFLESDNLFQTKICNFSIFYFNRAEPLNRSPLSDHKN